MLSVFILLLTIASAEEGSIRTGLARRSLPYTCTPGCARLAGTFPPLPFSRAGHERRRRSVNAVAFSLARCRSPSPLRDSGERGRLRGESVAAS